jgi:hypothetical protein
MQIDDDRDKQTGPVRNESEYPMDTIERISFSQPFNVADTTFHTWLWDIQFMRQNMVAERYELSSGSVRYDVNKLVPRADAPSEITERLFTHKILTGVPIALQIGMIILHAISAQQTIITIYAMRGATNAERQRMSALVRAILDWHAQVVSSASPVEMPQTEPKQKKREPYGIREDTKGKLDHLRTIRSQSIKNGKVNKSWTIACDEAGINERTAHTWASELHRNWSNPKFHPHFSWDDP